MSNEAKEVLEQSAKKVEELRALQEQQRKLLKRIAKVIRVALFAIICCSLGGAFCIRGYWISGAMPNGLISLFGIAINAFCVYLNARLLLEHGKRFVKGWAVSKQITYTILEAEKFRAFVIENEKLKDSPQ